MTSICKLSVLLPILTVVACDDGWDAHRVLDPTETIEGSGTIVEELRAASGCVDVTMGGVGILHIEQGSRTELIVRADDNLMPHLVTELAGGQLTIRHEAGVELRPSRPVEYFLTVIDIERIAFSGVGRVDTTGLQTDRLMIVQDGVGEVRLDNLDVESLDIAQTGAGDMHLSGAVFEQSVTLTGHGDYSAGELQSAQTEIHAAGVGSATLRVSDRLVVRISGVGCVYYIGDPTVASTVTGAGKVERISG